MTRPRIIVYYENHSPRKIVYDNGNVKIDLTEIMYISKVSWEFDTTRGMSMSTITFDAEVISEIVT